MQIISHRGLWETPAEKNSMAAFHSSFSAGWGTETDIRDLSGTLVISHDLPTGGEVAVVDFFALATEYPGLPLALNVKADGMAEGLRALLDDETLERSFVFDMSVPDMRGYFTQGIPVFARSSEVEPAPPWLERCAGLWLDSFGPTWFGPDDIERHLDAGLRICVVSSELHGREPDQLWQMLAPYRDEDRLVLCTDRPADFLGAVA